MFCRAGPFRVSTLTPEPNIAPRVALAAWLRLMQVSGLGNAARRALLKTFGLPEAIFAAGYTALAAGVGAEVAERILRAVPEEGFDALVTARTTGAATESAAARDGENPDQAILTALAWAEQPDQHIVTLADKDYPASLLTMEDPPLVLYVRGRLDLLAQPMFAVVGSRNATAQGERDAEAFSAVLGQAGLTVVSGLALGIDAAAHRGGLSSPAGTVAIVGTGVDRLYPARNAALAREIIQHGAIVSEFPLGTPALASNFPRRNRIIAGLGLGCLVVEAAPKSGSLITARLAAEAGHDVFAIPGSIHSPLSRGCHQLIRQGAKLVESAQDILEELRWQNAAPVLNKGNFDKETPAAGERQKAGTPRVLSRDGSKPAGRAGETASGKVSGVKAASMAEKGALPPDAAKPLASSAVDAQNPDAASHSEAQVLRVLGRAPCDLDTLAARSHLTPAALLAILLPLELIGRVAQLPGGLYQRLD